MNRFFRGKRQAACRFSAGALLWASLASAAQATPLAETSNLPADSHSPAGAVFASLSAYLQERGVFGELSNEHQNGLPPGLPTGFQIDDLALPSPPPPRAALQVTGCRWDALQQELQCYLRCATLQVCRPFLATIRPRNKEGSAALRAFAPSGQPSSRNQAQRTGSQKALLLVKTGEHVRLEMTGPGVHIQLAVVCLERGVLGQQVRARSMVDAKIFHARVVAPGLLATEFR